jgi:hypothetical protein
MTTPNSDDTNEQFDELSTYEDKIKPLVDQLIAICEENKIPFFLLFNVINDGARNCFCGSAQTFDNRTPLEINLCREVMDDDTLQESMDAAKAMVEYLKQATQAPSTTKYPGNVH